MVYFGKVQNGKIVPEPGARLTEGATVRIEPVEAANGPAAATAADPADDLARFAVRTGIPDLASRHDHYCSGAPDPDAPARGH
jgi:hypothetical protein